MSRFYKPHRTRNLYKPGDSAPFKLSDDTIPGVGDDCDYCAYVEAVRTITTE